MNKDKLKAYTVLAVGGIVVLLVIVGISIGLAQVAQPIQTGTYEGQTIDYSHQRGYIFQTNDLTTKTHERSSQREDWCVPDNRPELVEKVRGIEEGSEIRIEYYRPLWIHPDTCAGGLKVIEDITVTNSTAAEDTDA